MDSELWIVVAGLGGFGCIIGILLTIRQGFYHQPPDKKEKRPKWACNNYDECKSNNFKHCRFEPDGYLDCNCITKNTAYK